MVDLRLVGEGGEIPPSNTQLVAILEDVLEQAHRGEIHSVALVAIGAEQIHTHAFGHDVMLVGGVEMLKHSMIDYAMEMV